MDDCIQYIFLQKNYLQILSKSNYNLNKKISETLLEWQ